MNTEIVEHKQKSPNSIETLHLPDSVQEAVDIIDLGADAAMAVLAEEIDTPETPDVARRQDDAEDIGTLVVTDKIPRARPHVVATIRALHADPSHDTSVMEGAERPLTPGVDAESVTEGEVRHKREKFAIEAFLLAKFSDSMFDVPDDKNGVTFKDLDVSVSRNYSSQIMVRYQDTGKLGVGERPEGFVTPLEKLQADINERSYGVAEILRTDTALEPAVRRLRAIETDPTRLDPLRDMANLVGENVLTSEGAFLDYVIEQSHKFGLTKPEEIRTLALQLIPDATAKARLNIGHLEEVKGNLIGGAHESKSDGQKGETIGCAALYAQEGSGDMSIFAKIAVAIINEAHKRGFFEPGFVLSPEAVVPTTPAPRMRAGRRDN